MTQPTEKTFSMFSAPESRGIQKGLSLSDPPPEPQSLTEKYRPQSFRAVVGQKAAIDQLKAFVAAPYPTAFVFAGETGTGKTSAAVALATELGVDKNWSLHRISAGEMDAEAVNLALRSLRFVSPGGGWKLVLCDEADSMSAKAKQMWLSALEELSEKSVIVFTTNHLGRFEPRFLDRCVTIKFESNLADHVQDAQALVNAIWKAETGQRHAPPFQSLQGFTDPSVPISYRRLVRAIEPLIAASKIKPAKAPIVRPVAETIRIKPDSRPADEIDWYEIAARYDGGVGLNYLSRELGIPATTIHGRLKKLGVVFGQRKSR